MASKLRRLFIIKELGKFFIVTFLITFMPNYPLEILIAIIFILICFIIISIITKPFINIIVYVF